MRWGDGALRWVRPLHGIVAILGEDIVPVEIEGVVSGATTVGHRFHHPGPITIGGAAPAPVVPVEAVIRDGDQAAVWVVREPMLFHRRKVKTGLERDGRVQVLEGIDAGEHVVGRGAVFVDNESRS